MASVKRRIDSQVFTRPFSEQRFEFQVGFGKFVALNPLSGGGTSRFSKANNAAWWNCNSCQRPRVFVMGISFCQSFGLQHTATGLCERLVIDGKKIRIFWEYQKDDSWAGKFSADSLWKSIVRYQCSSGRFGCNEWSSAEADPDRWSWVALSFRLNLTIQSI